MYCSSHHAMTSLYRPAKMEQLNALMQTSRERFGAKLVPTNVVGVKKIMTALKNNHIVAILPDQDPQSEGGVFAPFFGITANTMTLLPRLANKTGAVVLFAYAERLQNSGFKLHFLPADEVVSSDDLQQAARSMNKGVEMCVRSIPEQYQWSYKRFKKRPPGAAKLYD